MGQNADYSKMLPGRKSTTIDSHNSNKLKNDNKPDWGKIFNWLSPKPRKL